MKGCMEPGLRLAAVLAGVIVTALLGCNIDVNPFEYRSVESALPALITRAEGVDGCLGFVVTAEGGVASYGSELSFSLAATNICPGPYTISSASRPPAGFCITTSGTTCSMKGKNGRIGNRYVALLPRDGWSPRPFEQVLLQNETYSATMPWDSEGEGMANRSPAPEGLYDVYAFLGGPDAVPFSRHLTVEVRN